MTIKEWNDSHLDVEVDTYSKTQERIMGFIMTDKKNGNWFERTISFDQLPLTDNEIVLEDYVCSILEQMYYHILNAR